MEAQDYIPSIIYHFYHQYYHLMLNACKEGLIKYPQNSSFVLYQSLALMLINRHEEGVHELESAAQKDDLKLASTIALIYGHKYLGVRKEILTKLDAQMKEFRKSADSIDFLNSAFVLVVFNRKEKALDFLEKSGNSKELASLKGWLYLMTKDMDKHTAGTVKDCFITALQHQSKDLLGYLGLIEIGLFLNEISDCLNLTNQSMLKFTDSNLPQLQKIKLNFTIQNWDQTIENLNVDQPLYVCNYDILINLCSKGDYQAASKGIKKLLQLLKKIEPNNTVALLNASKLFSRVSNRHPDIVKETLTMLESSLQTNADDIDLIVELATQNMFLQKTNEAIRLFKTATKINDNCFEAFLGLSMCEFLENGKNDSLLRQIQFLLEFKDADKSIALHLLQAKTGDTENHLNFIFNYKLHLLKRHYFGIKYLLDLEPDLCLEIVKDYLTIGNINNALDLVNIITKACPALFEANYLKSTVYYLKGDYFSALTSLDSVVNVTDTQSSELELFRAQIYVNSKQFERAAQSLEACASSNFNIRENFMYHYANGLVDKHAGNYAGTLNSLTTTLRLLNNTDKINQHSVSKATIYVELIDTLNIIGNAEESAKMLEEATRELKGTSEVSQILLLSADNMLARKNVQGAIDLLSKIRKDESCYKNATMKIADILLEYRKDRQAFLKVYEDQAQADPSAESYTQLGNAYIKVLEPERALENYEKAVKETPADLTMATRMGRALVQTHYFNKAVEYYKKIINEFKAPELKLELGELYLNLNEYEKGELLLLNELEDGSRISEDANNLIFRSQLYTLLSQIQEKSANFTYAVKSLKDGMDCLRTVRKRMVVTQEKSTEDIDKQLVDISMKLGEMAISAGNKEQAINYYKEGLTVSPDNVTILLALARLYMQMNYFELGQQTCNIILRIAPDNEAASVMMADTAFRKADFDMALFHFSQIISKQPTNWPVLKRLIEISRRIGQIEECETYVNLAEEKCANPLKEAGFLFSKACYQWHSGNLNAALKNFNHVRQDPEYGTRALYNMIEICLNPDDEMLAEQFMDSDDIEYKDSRALALKTAERLLKELKQRLESNGEELLKCRLLGNFRLLATKDKHNIESALEDFVAIASLSATKDNLGAILGMATAYTLLKQQQRAKNHLKRVVKNSWNFDDAEYLEKCWLLLADQYVHANKLDAAKELVTKIIDHNKSCTKAFEYLGYVYEKEHKFKDAGNSYKQAWTVGQRSNATSGYKLAYCLMKCKKYPEAIDVANEVLKLNADYGNMKKDILDKCMNNLRI